MKVDYRNRLESLLIRIRPRLQVAHRLEFKRCFGAVAGYVDGHIFVSCGKFGVAFRLPPKTLTELFRERDIIHLQYFPQGHIKAEYAVIPERILDDRLRLTKLLDRSIKHVLRASGNRSSARSPRS